MNEHQCVDVKALKAYLADKPDHLKVSGKITLETEVAEMPPPKKVGMATHQATIGRVVTHPKK